MGRIGDPFTQTVPIVGTTGPGYATQVNDVLAELITRVSTNPVFAPTTLADRVDILDYGAIPYNPNVHDTPTKRLDLATANTAAILAAISAASQLVSGGDAYGGNVFVPKGVYEVTASILLPNGVGLEGDTPAASMIRAHASFVGDYLVANTAQLGDQEFAFLSRITIDGGKGLGAVQNIAVVGFVSLFINSVIRDCVITNGTKYGLYVVATNAMGPVLVSNTWVIHCNDHNIYAGETNTNTQAVNGIFFDHVTSEHTATGKSAMYLAGFGHVSGVVIHNFHVENDVGPTGRTCLTINGCSNVVVDTAQFLQGAVGGATVGVAITSSSQNVGIQLRGIKNNNLVANILVDAKNSITLGAINIDGEYCTSDVICYGGKSFQHGGGTSKNLVVKDSAGTDRVWFDANGRVNGAGVFGAALEVVATPQGTPGASDDRAFIVADHALANAFGTYYPNGGGGAWRERNFSAGVDVRQVSTDGSVFNYQAHTFQNSLLNTARVAPAVLAANTNNYAPGIANKRKLIISASTPVNITGLAGGVDGQELFIYNSGTANTITLTNDDASSTAGNRIYCRGNANFALAARTGVFMLYDTTLARWLMV